MSEIPGQSERALPALQPPDCASFYDDIEWCCSFAACRVLGYVAFSRNPYFPRLKNRMDRAQEALRHDCPRSSSSACTGRLE